MYQAYGMVGLVKSVDPGLGLAQEPVPRTDQEDAWPARPQAGNGPAAGGDDHRAARTQADSAGRPVGHLMLRLVGQT